MKRLMMLMVVLIALAPFMGAQAGKPKPTPYPGPEVQPETYPAPEVPFEFPDSDDPQPGVPYAWGYFTGRWWVTYDAGWPQPDLNGAVCIEKSMGTTACYTLYFQFYDSALGRSWYATLPSCRSGTWWIYWASLGGMYADIRQPNNYLVTCVYIPQQFKEG